MSIITIFGATGNQGGSVIKAILANPTLSSKYKIRAVTRDASKPKAQQLAEQGAEVVVADMSDTSSVEKAIKGSTAVFSVTDFWSHKNKDTEVGQGKAVADVSKASGVKHLIWSGLPHVTKLTNGQLKHVEHFDGKAEVSEYIESIKGEDIVATYFMPAFYMSNFLTMIKPADEKTGEFTIVLPFGDGDKTQVPYIDSEKDTGAYVAAILLADPASVNGQHVQAVSQWATPNETANALSDATGKTFKYQDIPADVWAGFLPPPIATELKENMLLIRDYSYYGKGTAQGQEGQDKKLSLPKTSSLSSWAKSTGKWQ
ncbi:hypothetical protein CBS101457_005726 [Exobasidium rhododendri]|nr:hypothetical protein CBS101457_005726 [Exobasidium rhododendri]